MAPVYFHKEDHPEWGFLCQWYASKFKDENGKIFCHAEQYMMYHKALTFNDASAAFEISKTSSARKCKSLGRKVVGFDPAVWDPIKLSVVEQGSYLKYTHGIGHDAEELKRKLLATGNRELVEASKFDRVWGVGFAAEQCKEKWCEREFWGQNLLGQALMNARKRIREEDEVAEEKVTAPQ